MKYVLGCVNASTTAKQLAVTPDNWLHNEDHGRVAIEEFNKNPPQLKNFEAKLKLQGKNLAVDLTPTEEAGETPQQAIRGWFRRTVFGTQRKYYLNFQVDPDSFEEYLAIRKVMDNEQFFAGWQPTTSFNFTRSSGFNAGEKPPPRTGPPPPRRPGTVSNVLD